MLRHNALLLRQVARVLRHQAVSLRRAAPEFPGQRRRARFYRAGPRWRGSRYDPIKSARPRVDAQGTMRSGAPNVIVMQFRRDPKSNAQRQRDFRERHPDYNRQYKARVRAAAKARKAARLQAESAALPAAPQQLALPAPAVLPVIPGVNSIPATMAEMEAIRASREQALESATVPRTVSQSGTSPNRQSLPRATWS
jgi:hypothetical protein